MFCTRCGGALRQGAKFCPGCGAACEAQQPAPAAPEPPKPPLRKSRLLPGILLGAAAAAAVCAVLLLTGALSFGGADTVEGRGFSSPEAAAESYLEALRRGDLDGMLAAFAVESYTENLDQAAYLDASRVYSMQSAGLPDDNALAADLNAGLRKQNLLDQITLQYLTVTAATPELGEELTSPAGIHMDGTGREFLAAYVNPQAESWRTELEIGEPMAADAVMAACGADVSVHPSAAAYGYLNADEVAYPAVPVEIGGRPYLFCPSAVSYGGRWYLLDLAGGISRFLGGSSLSGGMVPYPDL